MPASYYIYIITNQKNGTLYIGMTSNLPRRVYEHQNGLFEGFSKRYDLKKLVYYESYDNPLVAITREKQMKAWQRGWKVKTIETLNPEWRDLAMDLNR